MSWEAAENNKQKVLFNQFKESFKDLSKRDKIFGCKFIYLIDLKSELCEQFKNIIYELSLKGLKELEIKDAISNLSIDYFNEESLELLFGASKLFVSSEFKIESCVFNTIWE